MSRPENAPSSLSSPAVVVTAFVTVVIGLTVWASPEADPVPPMEQSEEVAEGHALFTRYCALCHGANGEGHVADHAPALSNEEFLRIADDEYLTRSILAGRFGTPMAAFGERAGGPLGQDDITKIIAFLRSHQRAPPLHLIDAPVHGNAERGMTLFREHCVECHSIDQRETKAPRLDHPAFLSLASDAFIERSITVGRPGTPMEGWSERLRPDQIDDLVAAIRAWDKRPEVMPLRQQQAGHDHAGHDHAGHDHDVPAPVVDLWESVTDEELVLGDADAPGPAFDLEGRWYVSARQLRAALAANQRMILLDARPMSDWLNGHLPGALPVPYYSDHETLDRIPTEDTWVVLYCGCPHTAADRVATRLSARGVSNIAVLDEGFWHWKDNDYPIVSGPERF